MYCNIKWENVRHCLPLAYFNLSVFASLTNFNVLRVLRN